MNANAVLNAVDSWCGSDHLEREIGIIDNGMRLDGVIVPASWESAIYKKAKRFGLVGIEVKVTRSDFLAGLRRGQFEAYKKDKSIMGLILAVPRGIVKKSEVPDGVGLITVRQKASIERWRFEHSACCLRMPKFKSKVDDSAALWRIVMRMNESLRCRSVKAQDEKAVNQMVGQLGAEMISTVRKYKEVIGDLRQ